MRRTCVLRYSAPCAPTAAELTGDASTTRLDDIDRAIHALSSINRRDHLAAKRDGLVIVSKDADFRQLSFLHGCPPKVVWLRVGNRSTADIEALMRAHRADFDAFDRDPVAALLILTP